MHRTKSRVISIVASVLLVATLSADVVKIEIPPERGTFRDGPGKEVAQANCVMCHSAEYISSQPPMGRAFWEGSVKKMREKYGAPADDKAMATIVEYLVAAYGVPDPKK